MVLEPSLVSYMIHLSRTQHVFLILCYEHCKRLQMEGQFTAVDALQINDGQYGKNLMENSLKLDVF